MRVVVIGAGIVGTSTAYHLAKAGADVVLCERDNAGQATAAGAGIICPGFGTTQSSQAWYDIAYPAAAYYPGLIDALTDEGWADHSYATPGAIFASRPGPELDDLYALVRQRKEAGVAQLGEVKYLGPGEPAALFPQLDPNLAGVHASGAGRVDGDQLCTRLLDAALERGVEFVGGHARLIVDGDHVRGATLDDDITVGADSVVVAAGAWSRDVCAPVGMDLPVHPQRGQIVHLQLPEHSDDPLPIVQTFSRHYLLGFPGGRVIAGATRETGSGYDYRVTAAGLGDVLGNALRTAPGLGDATVAETRIGFRPASTDGLPLLGTAAPGLVVATGLGHTGLTIGPYAGALAANLALSESVPLDLGAYDPRRP